MLRRGGRGPLFILSARQHATRSAGAQGFICLFRAGEAECHPIMTDSNLNFWGELVVPVGVSICFGLALCVWLREELRPGTKENPKEP